MSNWDDDDFELNMSGFESDIKSIDIDSNTSNKDISQKEQTVVQKNSKKLNIKNPDALRQSTQKNQSIIYGSSKEQKMVMMRKMQEDNEINMMKDFFGHDFAKQDTNQVSSTQSMNTKIPETMEDFELLAENVANHLIQYDSNFNYIYFVGNLMKKLLINVSTKDMTQITSIISRLSNEKINLDKNKKNKKKKNSSRINPEIVHDGFIENEYDNYEI